MFELSYQLTDDSSQYMESYATRPEKLDEDELTWRCFLCRVNLKDGTADFTTPWGWNPVLHISLALLDITRNLRTAASEKYDFTENECWLKFNRKDNDVYITANYAPGVIKVRLADLEEAAHESFWSVDHELVEQHPGLERNPSFNELTSELSLEPDGQGDEDTLQVVIARFGITGYVGTQEERECIYELAEKLADALMSTHIGYWAWHDFDDKGAVLYLYGDDANRVYQVAEPILDKSPFKPIRVTLHYGSINDPRAKEAKRTLL